MKITYIYHSSFCVDFEEQKTAFIFDYFKGTIPEFGRDYNIYMLASHKHFDHFSKKIFEFANVYDNIHFVLSKETKMNEKYMDRWNIPMAARDKIDYVTYDTEYQYGAGEIVINTLKSTDSGVAFIISCFGKTIYHAGDLHWWYWDKFTEEQEIDMEKRFKIEVEKLSKYDIDVAFLPLDIRMEDRFHLGFDYYMRKCNIKRAFPMHCWEKYEAIGMLKEMDCSEGYRDRIEDISEENQTWRIVC